MKFLLTRLASNRAVFTAIVFASLLINMLALASPLFVIQVLNRYVAHGVDATLLTLTAGTVFAVIMEFGFRQVRLHFATSIAIQPDEALAVQNHQLITAIKQNTLQQVSAGMQRELLHSADALEKLAAAPNVATVMDLPYAVLFISVLALLSPMLAMIALFFLGAMTAAAWLGTRTVDGVNTELLKEKNVGASHFGSLLNAADEVRAFRVRRMLIHKCQNHVRRLQELSRRVSLHRGLMQSITHGGTAMMSICIIAAGAILVVRGELDVGIMIGANILASRALNTVNKFTSLNESFVKANQSLSLLRTFRDMPREMVKGAALDSYRGRIEFHDVGYSHPGSQNPLFESLSIALPAGAVMLVSGANGTGKTTFCRMIAGLIEPQRGSILADGVDMQQIVPNWWRGQICYVPQESRFVNGTVRDNLSTMNPEIEDKDLFRVIEDAGLKTFILESTEGLDQRIEDNGQKLSAGIRRRLSLARALTSECNLIVMDEPTEALDMEGQRTVYQLFERFQDEGKTIIVVSNDPQIIKSANVVMDLNMKPVPQFRKAQAAKQTKQPPKNEMPKDRPKDQKEVSVDNAFIRTAPSGGDAQS